MNSTKCTCRQVPSQHRRSNEQANSYGSEWKPLENTLGAPRCVGFMFMGRVNGINLYKHGISRSYLYLDDDGNCFVAAKHGCYIRADFDRELAKLEQCLN